MAIAGELPEASREQIKIRSKRLTPDDCKSQFIAIIKRRIHHCEEYCLNNLADAQICNDGQTIIWTGGHFSIPVHEELNRALKSEPHTWNRLVWQQIIRQMYEDEVKDEMLFQVATEALLVL